MSRTEPIMDGDTDSRESNPSQHEHDVKVTQQTVPTTTAMVPTFYLAERPTYYEVLMGCMQKNRSFDENKCVQIYQRHLERRSLEQSILKTNVSTFLTKVKFPSCLHFLEIVYYNPEKQLCCNGVWNKTTDYDSCCNGSIIDTRFVICCNDTVYKREGNDDCCGQYRYDVTKELCCGDDLYNLTEGQECCHGHVQPFVKNASIAAICCNRSNNDGECYSCQNGTQFVISLKKSNEICCNGKVKQKIHGDAIKCCQDKVLNTTTQICQNGHILHLDKGANGAAESGSGRMAMIEEGSQDYKISIIGGAGLAVVLFVVVGPCVILISIHLMTCEKRKLFILLRSCLYKSDRRHTRLANIPIPEESIELVRSCTPCSISQTRYNTSIFSVEYDDREQFMTLESKISLHDLGKNVHINKENLQTKLFLESSTQTKETGSIHRRSIFGRPFDYEFKLDESNLTLQMPSSEVRLILPPSLTRNGPVEVYSSTYRNIKEITEKFAIPDHRRMASPVVEYFIRGHKSKMNEHACMMFPFIGKADDLRCMKFESDEGISVTAKSTEILRINQFDASLDCFFIIKDQVAYIYTKSFSGFYFDTCRHKRDLELRAFVFGSYKRPIEQYEVFVKVYIADEIYKFEDYGRNMFENEENEERNCLKKDIRIEMPECELSDQDHIEAKITVKSEPTKWMHIIDDGRPVYPEKKNMKLSKVVQKCQQCGSLHTSETGRPAYNQWYLGNKDNDIPSNIFQFYIYLSVCKKDTDVRETTPIVIDKLELRKEDVSKRESKPIQETYNNFGDSAAERTMYQRGGADSQPDLPNTNRQHQTFVRGEAGSNLIPISTIGSSKRLDPPRPELSRERGTTGPIALQNNSGSFLDDTELA